jgi:hypothetical protein
MFTEFTPMRASLFKERVNTGLGIAFLSTVALWASMFIWNITSGNNPIDRGIATAIYNNLNAQQE